MKFEQTIDIILLENQYYETIDEGNKLKILMAIVLSIATGIGVHLSTRDATKLATAAAAQSNPTQFIKDQIATTQATTAPTTQGQAAPTPISTNPKIRSIDGRTTDEILAKRKAQNLGYDDNLSLGIEPRFDK